MTDLPDELAKELADILANLQELAARLAELIHPIPPR